MSGCAIRRWGAGPGCGGGSRPSDTQAKKELEAKLAAMRAERQRQDGMWGGPVPAEAFKPDPPIKYTSPQGASPSGPAASGTGPRGSS